jgi:hypothetical protein
MNKTLMEKIRVYLSLHPETRDCDRTLTTLIWTGELTRARRKLQEEDKTLRGEKWYLRKKLQEQYRQRVIEYKYS